MMHARASLLFRYWIAASLVLLSALFASGAGAATAGQGAVPYLQERLGLSDVQVRGALGALLVYSRERLPKPEFDDLTERFPNAEGMMQQVKARGVVTRPLDNTDELEQAFTSLGMPESTAAQFAPAVLDYLGTAGYSREQGILWRVLN